MCRRAVQFGRRSIVYAVSSRHVRGNYGSDGGHVHGCVSRWEVQSGRRYDLHRVRCGLLRILHWSQGVHLYWSLHRGVLLCSGVHQCHGCDVPRGHLQPGRRWGMHELQRGVVRGHRCYVIGSMQWTVSRRHVWCSEWVDVVGVQWQLHRGVRVRGWQHQRHSVGVWCGDLQPCRLWSVQPMSSRDIRSHLWPDVCYLLGGLHFWVRVSHGIHQLRGHPVPRGLLQPCWRRVMLVMSRGSFRVHS
jgi:hypothetical protein